MVAAYEDFPEIARADDDLIGARAIADDIPKIHDEIERGDRGQAGLQSFKVGVDVAKKKYAHVSPGKLPIIDPAEKIATAAKSLSGASVRTPAPSFDCLKRIYDGAAGPMPSVNFNQRGQGAGALLCAEFATRLES